MNPRMQLLSDDNHERTLPIHYSWEVMPDGQWKFTGPTISGYGYFVTAKYSGAQNHSRPADHQMNHGDVLGVSQGKCWRIEHNKEGTNPFDCIGIAMGWYENSDDTLIQITGTVCGLSSEWMPGSKIYVPIYGYGSPSQTTRYIKGLQSMGIALNKRDILLTSL